MSTDVATGGAKKKARTTSKKPATASSVKKKSSTATKRKSAKRKSVPSRKRGGTSGPTLVQLQDEARRLDIPLSKDGVRKNKATLQRAISSRK